MELFLFICVIPTFLGSFTISLSDFRQEIWIWRLDIVFFPSANVEPRKLCLNSGEIIAMSPNMRTIMEPMDVNEAEVFRLVVAIGCFLFLVRGGWVISFHDDQLRCPSILNWVSHGIWFWESGPSWNSKIFARGKTLKMIMEVPAGVFERLSTLSIGNLNESTGEMHCRTCF